MAIQKKGGFVASLRLINFVLHMYKQLTSEQRYAFSVMYHKKQTITSIAKDLGVSRSTLYRELKRNGGPQGGYGHAQAQAKANYRKQRLHKPRTYTAEVKREVHGLIRKRWSPKQISGWLLKEKGIKVSHETIYEDIRLDKLTGGDLWKFCRHAMKHRRRPVGKGSPIPDRVGLEERPPEADGNRFGDWEMDTIIGKDGKGAILTLTERKTNFSLAAKLPKGKDAEAVARTVVRLLTPYMKHVLTITTDNGSEFARHKYIAKNSKQPSILHTRIQHGKREL